MELPDFELRLEKKYPMITSRHKEEDVEIGYVTDGKRELSNMPFGLSYKDLKRNIVPVNMRMERKIKVCGMIIPLNPKYMGKEIIGIKKERFIGKLEPHRYKEDII